ncbi:uncharacterized protein LOC124891516 [Capsicum annuum]|uniref:uncharacterized protein LOC124891516 n=1 Tax=Capsicum annuum TaxID=4072 RepID=UPI001FB13A5F|nr:uncharacterized protein LOC124891516 [Capsicum annuum]
MVGGDYNVILNAEEKLSGLDVIFDKIIDFAQCVNNCALSGLVYKDNIDTCWNGRIEEECIFKRLEIILVNSYFLQERPNSESRSTYGNIFHKVSTLEDIVRVKELQLEINYTEENQMELRAPEEELRKHYQLEEKFWKQKSRMTWFKDGDRNTKFFLNYIRGKMKRLSIQEIENEQGTVLQELDSIREEAVNYFKK